MTCLRIVQSIWIHSAKDLDSFFKIHFESNRAKIESIGAKVESKIFKNESKTVKLCAIWFLSLNGLFRSALIDPGFPPC